MSAREIIRLGEGFGFSRRRGSLGVAPILTRGRCIQGLGALCDQIDDEYVPQKAYTYQSEITHMFVSPARGGSHHDNSDR